jgi:hypothetical protein
VLRAVQPVVGDSVADLEPAQAKPEARVEMVPIALAEGDEIPANRPIARLKTSPNRPARLFMPPRIKVYPRMGIS